MTNRPSVTMTATCSCMQSGSMIQPSWRDPRHCRQSLATRLCEPVELPLSKVLEEVEEGVGVEKVGKVVGKEVGRPG